MARPSAAGATPVVAVTNSATLCPIATLCPVELSPERKSSGHPVTKLLEFVIEGSTKRGVRSMFARECVAGLRTTARA
jgi:hypothetical protein